MTVNTGEVDLLRTKIPHHEENKNPQADRTVRTLSHQNNFAPSNQIARSLMNHSFSYHCVIL